MINEMLSVSRKKYFLPKHRIRTFCKYFQQCTCAGAYTAEEMHLSSTDNPHTKFENIANVDNLKTNATKMLISQASKVKTLMTQEKWSLITDCRSWPELGLTPATAPTEAGPPETIKVHLSTGHAPPDPELLPSRINFKKETLPCALKLSHLGSLNPDTPWRG